MKKIQSSLVYYNANTRNADVGDCVKRGLSVAYSMDYDEVSAELNRIKRDLGYSQFNIDPVFQTFMKRRGDTFTRVPESEQVTAEEFCEQHPTGVYVILVGKHQGKHTSHLAAIVNGDLYDSWNSLNYFVVRYAKVSQGKSDVYTLDEDLVSKTVASNVSEYLDTKLVSKLPDSMTVRMGSSVFHDSKYTYEMYLVCQLSEMPKYCKYRSNSKLNHCIVMKMNPRMSDDENIASLTKKCKQKVYDWVYNIKAEILAGERVDKIGAHKHFSAYGSGAPDILGKLPDWAIPHVLSISDNGQGYDYGERYELTLQALPEDPRYDESRYVDFYADNLRELKDDLEMYHTDFARINYDY